MKALPRLYILYVLMLLAGWSFSQVSLLQFYIKDKNTKDAINFCYVVVKGKNNSSVSDEQGLVKLKADANDTLVIYQFGYQLKKVMASEITLTDNTVLLERKNIQLGEVTVTTEAARIFREKDNTVFIDFEFYDDQVLCLINKGSKYNSLLLSDKNGDKITETNLSIKCEKLYKDCFNNIHLITEDSIYQVFYDYQQLHLLPPFSIRNYYSILLPCQSFYNDTYVFKTKQYKALKAEYILYNEKEKYRKSMACVADSVSIRGFNTDYNINYFLNIRRKGLGYPYSVAEIVKHIDQLREEIVLPQSYATLLRPLESELRQIDTNLFLFDYTNKEVYRFSERGDLQKKSALNRFDGIVPRIMLDKDAGNCLYAEQSNLSGILKLYRYDHLNNKLSHSCTLEKFYYLKNYKIKENHLYFIHVNRNGGDVKTKLVKVFLEWEPVLDGETPR